MSPTRITEIAPKVVSVRPEACLQRLSNSGQQKSIHQLLSTEHSRD